MIGIMFMTSDTIVSFTLLLILYFKITKKLFMTGNM